MAGGWSVTCDAGNTLGDCEETIVLQHSWLWLDRSQGIEPQHCIVCGSSGMADMQSANCNSSIATSADKTKVDLRSIFLDFTNIRRPKSRKDARKTGQALRSAVIAFAAPPGALQHGLPAPGVTSFSFTVSLTSTARLTYPLPLSRLFVEGFLQRRSNSKHRTVPIHRRRSITPACVRPIKSDLIPMETLLDTAVRS